VEGVEESLEGGAQTVIDSVASDAAAFPWFAAIMGFLIIGGITWSLVEVIKVTAVSRLKRKPPKTATERTVMGRITKQFPWYPLVIWSVSIFGGAALGVFAGVMHDQLLWWRGLLLGAFAGALNGVAMKVLRTVGDKASDLLLGWLKRRIGNGNGNGDKDDK